MAMFKYCLHKFTGAYSGGGVVKDPPPERFSDFQNLKRKSTVTYHSNRKRDKEEEGYGKRRNM
jgi:hypothetical protein